MTTALVTGPTAGIGAAFARRLARDGHRLVLVARNAATLQDLADELARRYGVPAGGPHEVLAADLSDAAARGRVEERLRSPDAPVDVLVNNAGIGTTGTFWTTDPTAAQVQYDLAVTAVFRLTRAALEGMVERDRGTVVNVASFGALLPGRNGAAYTAAKSYVVALSERIAAELKGTGVSITALCPGWTRTELHDRAGVPAPDPGSAMWLDADDVVARAMSDVARGRARSIPGLHYRLLLGMSEILPRAVMRRG